MENLNLKKFFLYLLITSVAISALIGIGVILIGDFGELEAKILGTTFTIALTSILGLACGAYLETKRGKILPTAGIVFSIISAILCFILIWANQTFSEEIFLKILASVVMFAVACSHLSLISIAQLEAKFQWSKITLFICVWLLVAILLYIIWFTPESSSDLIIRIIAVLSIVIAALTIITPIFYKLSSTLPEAEQIDQEIERLKLRLVKLEEKKQKLTEDL